MIDALIYVVSVYIVKITMFTPQQMGKNSAFQAYSARTEGTGEKTVNIKNRVKIELNLIKSFS